jgi:predicted AlkP superfamily pyrophosphatase or phosphodiesterase
MSRRTKLNNTVAALVAWALLLALGAVASFAHAQQAAKQAAAAHVEQVANAENAAEAQQQPYVVLVSLDGFRNDYTRKYAAPNLVAMAARGATAPDGMIPSYPSSTFPNHLTIITGLYPEHHGIVANVFYDPARDETYNYADRKAAWDGSWYAGVPLWSLAENNRMRAACFFWPASEAQMPNDEQHWTAGNRRPSYFVPYEPQVPNDERVEQAIAWLKLPAAERPHFVTVYMGDVDGAGHPFGPDAPETAAAVKDVDAEIGKLEAGIEALHLRVDVFVVADHGMQKTDPEWVNLDTWTDLPNFKGLGPLMYAPTEAEAQHAYEALKGKSDKFNVYRRVDVPAHLHYNENPRTGDPVVVATGPFYIRARRPKPGEPDMPPSVGTHGYDPQVLPTMKALFVAAGPDIRAGVKVAPFENVDVYPVIAKILGLPVGKIDGDEKALDGILKK